jgi:hypothetical protein
MDPQLSGNITAAQILSACFLKDQTVALFP